MKTLSDKELRKLSIQGRTEKIVPVKKPVASISPEDKQVIATKEMLSIIKDSSDKTERMASVTMNISNIFLKAMDVLSRVESKSESISVKSEKKITEWEFTVTKRTMGGNIESFTAKAVSTE